MNNHTTSSKDLILARTLYISVWAAVTIFALLCENDLLPIGYVTANAQTEYMLNLLCIVLTLTCTWGSLRLFATKKVRNSISNKTNGLCNWNLLRTSILAFSIIVNLITYYGLANSTSALFCLLITLAGFVFCWPKHYE